MRSDNFLTQSTEYVYVTIKGDIQVYKTNHPQPDEHIIDVFGRVNFKFIYEVDGAIEF